MDPLDKKVIGERVKHLRKSRGLRQWQMAERLSATQPAVHKYENGILPEVKRLLELARIGNTSVEWILTGRHWENGSAEMERMDSRVYELASHLQSLSEEDRKILAGALDVINDAVARVRQQSGMEPRDMSDAELARAIRAFESNSRETLIAALSLHDAVVTTATSSKVREIHRFGTSFDERESARPGRSSSIQKNAG